jgi:hypothetical protein
MIHPITAGLNPKPLMCRLEDKDELLLDDLEDTPPPLPEGLEAELRMGDICDYAEVLKVRNLGF